MGEADSIWTGTIYSNDGWFNSRPRSLPCNVCWIARRVISCVEHIDIRSNGQIELRGHFKWVNDDVCVGQYNAADEKPQNIFRSSMIDQQTNYENILYIIYYCWLCNVIILFYEFWWFIMYPSNSWRRTVK